jgi:hypothetical protein
MVKHASNQTMAQYWRKIFVKIDRLERRIVNMEVSFDRKLDERLPSTAKVYNDSAAPPRRIAHGTGSVQYRPAKQGGTHPP